MINDSRPELNRSISMRNEGHLNFSNFPYASSTYPEVTFFISLIVDKKSSEVEVLIIADNVSKNVNLERDINRIINKLNPILVSYNFQTLVKPNVTYGLLTNNQTVASFFPIVFNDDQFTISAQTGTIPGRSHDFFIYQIELLLLKLDPLNFEQDNMPEKYICY